MKHLHLLLNLHYLADQLNLANQRAFPCDSPSENGPWGEPNTAALNCFCLALSENLPFLEA